MERWQGSSEVTLRCGCKQEPQDELEEGPQAEREGRDTAQSTQVAVELGPHG